MAVGKILVLRHRGKILTALVCDNRFLTVSASSENAESIVGNVYIGKVQNIVNNIQAAFVEVNKGLLCYLSLSDIKNPVLTNGREWDGKLRIGDELLVQIERDALKTKQPALTTKISVSGQYLVFTSEQNGSVGISGKLSASVKKEIKEYLSSEHLQSGFDVIVRTNAGELEDFSLIKAEWQALSDRMSAILERAKFRTCYSCLQREIPGYLKAIKDIYQNEYDEIVTDDTGLYQEIKNFLEESGNNTELRLYEDKMLPLGKLYSVDSRLTEATGTRIWLKSGGYLVIEQTEALTVIDVNTGKFDAKKGIPEETYYKINLDAAKEIALQLRLRNLSGIIVVDFINMKSKKLQDALMQELKTYCRKDPVRTDVVDMTGLGLVEITRKKINKPLSEQLSD